MENTLYVFIGKIDKQSFADYFDGCVNEAVESLRSNGYTKALKRTYLINVPASKNNETKRAFIWLDDVAIANKLVGLTHDGKLESNMKQKYEPKKLWFRELDYNILFQRARCFDPEQGRSGCILESATKVSGISPKMISDVFSRYGVSGPVKCTVDAGYAVVEFKQGSSDAGYALLMCYYTKIGNKSVKFVYSSV